MSDELYISIGTDYLAGEWLLPGRLLVVPCTQRVNSLPISPSFKVFRVAHGQSDHGKFDPRLICRGADALLELLFLLLSVTCIITAEIARRLFHQR